jgi:hypothetical protein
MMERKRKEEKRESKHWIGQRKGEKHKSVTRCRPDPKLTIKKEKQLKSKRLRKRRYLDREKALTTR